MPLGEMAILALATWRIANLLQTERGPGALLVALRIQIGIEHDADGTPTSWPDTETGRLWRCLWCFSIWVGLGLGGLYLLAPWVALALALPFALSAAAIGLEVIANGTSRH